MLINGEVSVQWDPGDPPDGYAAESICSPAMRVELARSGDLRAGLHKMVDAVMDELELKAKETT